jgi:hypothetical protein
MGHQTECHVPSSASRLRDRQRSPKMLIVAISLPTTTKSLVALQPIGVA